MLASLVFALVPLPVPGPLTPQVTIELPGRVEEGRKAARRLLGEKRLRVFDFTGRWLLAHQDTEGGWAADGGLDVEATALGVLAALATGFDVERTAELDEAVEHAVDRLIGWQDGATGAIGAAVGNADAPQPIRQQAFAAWALHTARDQGIERAGQPCLEALRYLAEQADPSGFLPAVAGGATADERTTAVAVVALSLGVRQELLERAAIEGPLRWLLARASERMRETGAADGASTTVGAALFAQVLLRAEVKALVPLGEWLAKHAPPGSTNGSGDTGLDDLLFGWLGAHQFGKPAAVPWQEGVLAAFDARIAPSGSNRGAARSAKEEGGRTLSTLRLTTALQSWRYYRLMGL